MVRLLPPPQALSEFVLYGCLPPQDPGKFLIPLSLRKCLDETLNIILEYTIIIFLPWKSYAHPSREPACSNVDLIFREHARQNGSRF